MPPKTDSVSGIGSMNFEEKTDSGSTSSTSTPRLTRSTPRLTRSNSCPAVFQGLSDYTEERRLSDKPNKTQDDLALPPPEKELNEIDKMMAMQNFYAAQNMMAQTQAAKNSLMGTLAQGVHDAAAGR